ncbi:MAG: hypothetical protein ACI9ON_001492 [Limisphaerales bacterium]|jgi:hypothetical protein
MRAIKILAILLGVYVLVVVVFESLLGYYQPANQSTLVITTTNTEGVSNDRVLAKIEFNDQVYIAANHWPRAWYRQAMANPNVSATIDEEKNDYVAVPVTDAEHAEIDGANSLGLVFKMLTGFPPRYFLRLDMQ